MNQHIRALALRAPSLRSLGSSTLAVCLALGMSACGNGDDAPRSEAPEVATEAMDSMHDTLSTAADAAEDMAAAATGALDAAAAQAALLAADRSEEDRARDAGRRPAEVLAFLGVRPGDTVLDVIAAGGWYTEVLAAAVGPEGTVYAQNPAVVLQFRDGANDKALTARLADDRLPNVVRLDQELTELAIEPGSVDVAITALNFHDIHNGSGRDAAVGTARMVHDLLRPGGVFGVIDHAGVPDQDNVALHRMLADDAASVLEEAGFEVTRSDALANPDDPHDVGVFDPAVRGHTDRFLLRAVRR